MSDEETFLSIREVAGRLSVSYQTIWGMVRAGELPAIRIRHAIRIPESALGGLPKYEPPKVEKGVQG